MLFKSTQSFRPYLQGFKNRKQMNFRTKHFFFVLVLGEVGFGGIYYYE